ncbi:putative bifunctional diguanylate cyclase/phosphodiesterase [Marinobacter sp. OP 3.4]|uniref:putative bifunctional diguanylate cyclase/phosphodiesterase n=1 Tax=Marinobacter sp. OP 3.4 TaxID=3076501 RepID=UPI002E207C87
MDYTGSKNKSDLLDFSPKFNGRLPAGLKLIGIGCLLLASATLVYMTGGTSYAYPYAALLPVLLSASWFGFTGAIVCGILGGLLLGPWMPLNVSAGSSQTAENWLARIAFFVVIGVFASVLFRRLRQANQRHLESLQIDHKTGLHSQAALIRDLELFGQYKDEALQAILLIRMQDLWEILQSMGAETADRVVKEVADRVGQHLGRSHRIYRFSKSELAILFSAKSQEEIDSVFAVSQKIGEQETVIDGIALRIQIAAGGYLFDPNEDKSETIINRARTGLSVAMENNVPYRLYDPSFDKMTAERVKLIAQVRDGLENQEFELFHQPKICLRKGKHVGSEALLRWVDQDGHIVMPGLFMPKVEATTLIDPVTRFVIAQACQRIQSEGLMPVSINFAVNNLMDSELIGNLGRVVASHGCHPESLEIEITEGALIQDPARAEVAVKSLRDQGFKVSLDDFGTGYSSFQYLTHIPLSGLKIDRAFVTNLEHSEDARTIMESMISMAHALKLEVTVEGIETLGQHKIVTELGADLGQGYYYSRPLPLTEYRQYVENR